MLRNNADVRRCSIIFRAWATLPSCDQFTIKYNPRFLFISEYTDVTYFDRPHVMFINKNGNTCSMIMLVQFKKVMNMWNVVIEVGEMLRKLRLYVASDTQRNATHSVKMLYRFPPLCTRGLFVLNISTVFLSFYYIGCESFAVLKKFLKVFVRQLKAFATVPLLFMCE